MLALRVIWARLSAVVLYMHLKRGALFWTIILRVMMVLNFLCVVVRVIIGNLNALGMWMMVVLVLVVWVVLSVLVSSLLTMMVR